MSDHKPRDVKKWIGLDRHATGTYEYVKWPYGQGRDRSFVYDDGIRYEHCDDDLDGCWLYRAVRF